MPPRRGRTRSTINTFGRVDNILFGAFLLKAHYRIPRILTATGVTELHCTVVYCDVWMFGGLVLKAFSRFAFLSTAGVGGTSNENIYPPNAVLVLVLRPSGGIALELEVSLLVLRLLSLRPSPDTCATRITHGLRLGSTPR